MASLGAFITVTRPQERGDTFYECSQQAHELCDEVTVVDGETSWPQEFTWPEIGQHFQIGYEVSKADWVLHLDTDFIIHEQDFQKIRDAIERHPNDPALSMVKYQFIRPDRYNVKSRLVTLVNKGVYGERIRFDSGGDLCAPSLDGVYIDPASVPSSGAAIWNFEKLAKTEEQIIDDVGRMARAWQRHFGEYKLGGPDDGSAYRVWREMIEGRFRKPQQLVKRSELPRVMQDTIRELIPEQFGHNGFGWFND